MVVEPETDRIEQHEPADERRDVRSQLAGEHATERLTDDRRAVRDPVL